MIRLFRHALRAIALLALIPLTSSVFSATPDASSPAILVEAPKQLEQRQPSQPHTGRQPAPSAQPSVTPTDLRPSATAPKPSTAPSATPSVTPSASTATSTSTAARAPVILPKAATGIRHTTTTSSVTFAWTKVPGAANYTVCLLASATAPSCSRLSSPSASTSASFTGLNPTPGVDYYYRVISRNSAGQKSSKTYAFDLPVSTVAGLKAKSDGKQHIVLTWSPTANASNYAVQIATNKAMTAGGVNATASAASYTSAALKPGATYYYRVRGLNDATSGAYSPVGGLRLDASGTTARVVSFNLCGQDKCLSSTNGMKKWSTRKPIAGALVRSANADIIATQESSYVDTKFGTQLPGFTLAHHKSAKSLFFKASKYTEVSSGSITLSSSLKKYAVWADLKDIATGTRFIVVDAHLHSGKGKAKDDERTRETNILIAAVKKINPSGLPVIYAGDFNSNDSNANQSRYKGGYDAPLRAFTAAGAIDSFNVAETFVNQIYNSANQAKNPPLKHSDHVDHIFTSADIRTASWKVMLKLSGSNYAMPLASDHNPIVADLVVPGR